MSDYVPTFNRVNSKDRFVFNASDVALDLDRTSSDEDWEQLSPQEEKEHRNSVTGFNIPFGLRSFASGSVVHSDVGEVQFLIFKLKKNHLQR